MNPEYACQHPEGLIAEPSREPAYIRIETADSPQIASRAILERAFWAFLSGTSPAHQTKKARPSRKAETG
jgi:hypothetical protein